MRNQALRRAFQSAQKDLESSFGPMQVGETANSMEEVHVY